MKINISEFITELKKIIDDLPESPEVTAYEEKEYTSSRTRRVMITLNNKTKVQLYIDSEISKESA